MKSTKRAYALNVLFSILLLFTSTACSAGGTGPDWDESILVYATLNPNGVDRGAVDEFNRTHTDVQIEVRSYYDEGDPTGQIGRERLITEIMAGRIPDILDISFGEYGLPYRQMAERGYLENLWPYIENDPELGRESVMEAPLRAAEVNGGLYAVFRSVTINTLVGAENVVGARNSWTLDDLRAAFAAMPEGSTITDYYAGQDLMFAMICRVKLDGYVDWETGRNSFDSEDFRTTLEFINSFPRETDAITDGTTGAPDMEKLEELGRRRQSGRQMLSMVSVMSLYEVQMNDLQFRGRTAFVGYPVGDGSVGSSFEPSTRRLAISTTCRNKTAAWDFLREELLPQDESEFKQKILSSCGNGFPINRADYELMRRICMSNESGFTVYADGSSVTLPPLSEEEVQRFEELYNSIEKIDLRDTGIYDIVWEQAQAYFSGDKTLNETVELIQRQITLYVNEQK